MINHYHLTLPLRQLGVILPKMAHRCDVHNLAGSDRRALGWSHALADVGGAVADRGKG